MCVGKETPSVASLKGVIVLEEILVAASTVAAVVVVVTVKISAVPLVLDEKA